jgi:hypothetical protein
MFFWRAFKTFSKRSWPNGTVSLFKEDALRIRSYIIVNCVSMNVGCICGQSGSAFKSTDGGLDHMTILNLFLSLIIRITTPGSNPHSVSCDKSPKYPVKGVFGLLMIPAIQRKLRTLSMFSFLI